MNVIKRYAQSALGNLRVETAHWNADGALLAIANALAPIIRTQHDYYAQTVEGYALLTESQYQAAVRDASRARAPTPQPASGSPTVIDVRDGVNDTEASVAAKALNARRKPKASKPK